MRCEDPVCSTEGVSWLVVEGVVVVLVGVVVLKWLCFTAVAPVTFQFTGGEALHLRDCVAQVTRRFIARFLSLILMRMV